MYKHNGNCRECSKKSKTAFCSEECRKKYNRKVSPDIFLPIEIKLKMVIDKRIAEGYTNREIANILYFEGYLTKINKYFNSYIELIRKNKKGKK